MDAAEILVGVETEATTTNTVGVVIMAAMIVVVMITHTSCPHPLAITYAVTFLVPVHALVLVRLPIVVILVVTTGRMKPLVTEAVVDVAAVAMISALVTIPVVDRLLMIETTTSQERSYQTTTLPTSNPMPVLVTSTTIRVGATPQNALPKRPAVGVMGVIPRASIQPLRLSVPIYASTSVRRDLRRSTVPSSTTTLLSYPNYSAQKTIGRCITN